MSTTSTPHQDCMGVTLLERGYFRDAMKTFKDRLALMESTSSEDQQREESLNRSARYIAGSSASSQGPALADFELTALSHNYSPAAAMTAAIHEFQSSGTGFVLCLEWNNEEQDKDADV